MRGGDFSSNTKAVSGSWENYIAPADRVFLGSGTVSNPYLIEREGQLAYLSTIRTDFGNRHYKLVNNLDMGAHYWSSSIGYNAGIFSGFMFNGGFDGNYKTIRNLNCLSGVYLFRSIWGTSSYVKNLFLENVNGVYICALLAPSAVNSTISRISIINSSFTPKAGSLAFVRDGAGGIGSLIGCCNGARVTECRVNNIRFNNTSDQISGMKVGGFIGDVRGSSFIAYNEITSISATLHSVETNTQYYLCGVRTPFVQYKYYYIDIITYGSFTMGRLFGVINENSKSNYNSINSITLYKYRIGDLTNTYQTTFLILATTEAMNHINQLTTDVVFMDIEVPSSDCREGGVLYDETITSSLVLDSSVDSSRENIINTSVVGSGSAGSYFTSSIPNEAFAYFNSASYINNGYPYLKWIYWQDNT